MIRTLEEETQFPFIDFSGARQLLVGLPDAEDRHVYMGQSLSSDPKELNKLRHLKGHKAIRNIQSGHVCQISSAGYQILQHRDYFALVVSALEHAGLSGSGRFVKLAGGDAWKMQVLFDNITVSEPGKGQNIQVGGEFLNSYNATTSASGRAFFMRMSCMNQMVIRNLIPGVIFSKNHVSRSQEELLTGAQGKIGDYVDSLLTNCHLLEPAIEKAMGSYIRIEGDEIVPTIENIVGARKHAEEIALKLEPELNGEISRWELYNAITDYASHGDISPSVQDSLLGKAERKVLNPKAEIVILAEATA